MSFLLDDVSRIVAGSSSRTQALRLIGYFGDKVFRTVIPRNIRLAEAPSFGKPALIHDRESRGALAYLALAGDMIRREEEASSEARSAAHSNPAANGGSDGTEAPAADPGLDSATPDAAVSGEKGA